MSVGLAAPLFLAGLLAVAIPFLIHLVQREESAAHAFPSLMFLRSIVTRVRRQRTIRHWWLLALRCLAVALLCLAFAAPFFTSQSHGSAADATSRDRVVVLDRSYSMGYGDRWPRAVALARESIAALEPGDRAALVLFDHAARVISGLDLDHERVLDLLAATETGAAHTDLVSGLEAAGKLLAEDAVEYREIVLVSDFQQSGHASGKQARVPEGVEVVALAVDGGGEANAAVASAELAPRGEAKEHTTELKVRVVNTGPQRMNDLGLAMEVNGRELESRRFHLEPRASRDERFRFVTATGDLTRVRLQLDPDALDTDNAYHMVLSNAPEISLLVLEGDEGDSSLFLERALARGTAPGFQVHRQRISAFRASDLDRVGAVVVNDAPVPGGDAGERLRRFVAEGGGLLLVSGEGMVGAWPGGPEGIAPGELGRLVTREEGSPARLVQLDTTHPALAAFDADAGGDLGGAQVYRYRQLSQVSPTGIVARYDDGAVAMAERRVGKGRVLVLTTGIDTTWSSLPQQPGFLPWMRETMKYLAGYLPASPAFSVGDVVDLGRYARALPGYDEAAAALARGATSSVRTPSGRRVHLGAGDVLLPLRETGFYEVHVSGGGERSLLLAVNGRFQESKLEALNPRAFLAGITRSAAAGENAPGEHAASTTRTRELWWLVLLVFTGLLMAETLVSNGLSRPSSRSPS